MAWRIRAKGRAVRRTPGEMNGTERAYADTVLEPLKRAGEIAHYWFEQFTFKLAADLRYTPDFVVMLSDGELECHEIKGEFIREDALIKLKLAAQTMPFLFKLCVKRSKKNGGGWKIDPM